MLRCAQHDKTSWSQAIPVYRRTVLELKIGCVWRATGAYPLLWTTGLMAPEAYTLKAALDGWIGRESHDQIHERAAVAYDKY